MSATARIMAWLGMDSKDFSKGVDQAGAKVKGFEGALSGLKGKLAAAFSVAAIYQGVKSTVNMAGEIIDAAEALGVTTDEFQALTAAANDMGISSDQVATALGKLNAVLADLTGTSPTKELKEQIESLGISLSELDQMNPAQFFERLAQAGDMDVAFKAMGTRSGPRFAALMRQVARDGLKGMIESSASQIASGAELSALDALADKGAGFLRGLKAKAADVLGTVAGVIPGTKTSESLMLSDEDRIQMAQSRVATRRKADEQLAYQIAEETEEIRKRNAYELLSVAEKRASIEEEIAAIDRKRADAEKLLTVMSDSQWAMLEKQRAELEGKLQGLKDEGRPGEPMMFDQLRRIGANVFEGRMQDQIPRKQLSLQERQLAKLEMIREELKRKQEGRF